MASPVIPDVLMTYLHTLVDSDPTITEIVLTPTALGWSEVQDITLISGTTTYTHRVFGFPPMQAVLTVAHHANHCLITEAA